MKNLLLCIMLCFGLDAAAQIAVNDDGSAPHNSAMLDVKSTEKGLLPPRMNNSQMNAIVNPASGLLVFCTDCGAGGTGSMAMFMNGIWYLLNVTCLNPTAPVAGTHVPSPTQIIWNWNAVPGATGYKWNTTNDYATATDMAASTTKTETGLTCSTAYTRYIWAYNGCGNSTVLILNQATTLCPVICGQPLTDTRDGKTYNTVAIGTQCWFAQNLNIGTKVPSGTNQTNNSIIEKYCYDDNDANCNTYGGLYQWDEAMQYSTIAGVEGICPSGWHFPGDNDWTTLTIYLGGVSIAGGKMKETGTSHWSVPNAGANNSSGFTSLPGGYKTSSNGYLALTSWSFMWSSSQYDATRANHLDLYTEDASTHQSYDDKTSGISIRCVSDTPLISAIPTITTSSVTSIAQTTATSGGNITSDGGATVTARGICWSTSSTPTTANNLSFDGSGNGAFVSNLTGLVPNTLYYVRAYATNSAGTAYGNEISFTTLPLAFTCGSSITVNHIAGAVAPVNKTVTYGTVTNIPGETSKCWITSNLGADHQATAVSDATEPSAGWYWQFNHKQGFKHDGTTRTPNTTWISFFNENSNWIAANDPCALELGNGWRIPTNTELTNVDASGNWTTWTGPYNSGLKLHAAGYLYSDGTLQTRGSSGDYWSNVQVGGLNGWTLYFENGYSDMNYLNKYFAFSLRCIKD